MKPTLLVRLPRIAIIALAGLLSTKSKAADYPTTVLGLNPIAYYRLTEASQTVPADVVTNTGSFGAAGNGFYLNDRGTPENDYTHGEAGAIVGSPDTAVTFTGTGNGRGGISIPWSKNLNPSGPFTVEAWVLPLAQIEDNKAFFCALDASSSGIAGVGRSGWLLYQAGTTWQFRLGDANGYIATAAGGANEIGTWYHIAGVYNGTHANLYVNGVLAASEPLARPFEANPGETTDIGFSSAFARNINATVDECAIYPTILSQEELLAHYQNGTNGSRAIAYDQLVLSKNPVGYWRLNEPAFTPADPSTYPIAVNAGTKGAAANGVYDPGTVVGVSGVPFAGFGADSKAVKFNGVSSDIQIPPLDSVSVNQFTFAGWILSESTGQANPGWPGYAAMMWHQADASGFLGVGLHYWYDGKTLSTIWTEGETNNYGQLSAWAPPVYVWNFVAAVWTPTSTTVYLNGEPSNIAASGTHDPHDFSAGSVFLGRTTDPQYWGFQGRMAEPALFNRALTAAEIRSLYDAALATPQVTSLTQTPSGPNFEGQTIDLNLSAIGPGTLAYQWRKGGVPLNGKTTTNLSLVNVTVADSGSYDVVLNNANGSSTSAPVVLTVTAVPPQIFQQPLDAVRYAGGSAIFSVSAGGSTPITYQWSYNGSAIPGATSPSYTVASVGPANIGKYNVLLTNPNGTSNSIDAVLSSVPAPGGYAGAIVAAHPSAYWRFNETSGATAFDYVGGHNGSYTGPVTNGVAGPSGASFIGLESSNTSYSFEGVFSLIKTQPPIPVNGNTLTTIALVNRSSAGLNAYACILVSTREINDVAYFCVGNDRQSLAYDFNDDPASYNFESALITPEDQWAFVAQTVAADQAVLFMDDGSGTGLQAVTNVLAAASIPLDGSVSLGGDPNLNLGQDRTWKGGLDEIAYFTRTLSYSEIAAIHDALLKKGDEPLTLSISVVNGNVVISYATGTLQSVNELGGSWTDVQGASPPSYNSATTANHTYYRVKN